MQIKLLLIFNRNSLAPVVVAAVEVYKVSTYIGLSESMAPPQMWPMLAKEPAHTIFIVIIQVNYELFMNVGLILMCSIFKFSRTAALLNNLWLGNSEQALSHAIYAHMRVLLLLRYHL